jgi:ACS family tartrate transporter-like MFS transporter
MNGAFERAVLAKVTWRLIPFMFVLYIVAYLDRINVGFAALQMNQDLGLTPAVYGFGAGIFFIGYFLFEIPSNLILQRVGARLWIARILITWGIIASATMLVRNAESFVVARFLLGAAEAGFFPGMILYLTYWYPAAERARTVALFMTATAIAGVVGGPVSGAILSLHGAGGLAGWQWLFLLEGLPAIILGVVVLVYLPDGPERATWLAPEERTWLRQRLAADREAIPGHYTLRQALTSGRVWLLCLLYLALVIGTYGLSMWLPQIIEGFSGLGDFGVGLLSAVPYLAAAVAMVLVGSHSDRTGERRWHLAVPALVGAIGLALSAFLQPAPVLALAALSLAALGIWSAFGPFWSLPTTFLTGTAAAGGMALINSVGNLGGFLGPYLVGAVRSTTQSFTGGLLALALILLLGVVLALCLRPAVAVAEPSLVRTAADS